MPSFEYSSWTLEEHKAEPVLPTCSSQELTHGSLISSANAKKVPEESFRSWKGNADADVKTDAAVMKLSRMAARLFRLADKSAIMSREAGLKYIPLSIKHQKTEKLLSSMSHFL